MRLSAFTILTYNRLGHYIGLLDLCKFVHLHLKCNVSEYFNFIIRNIDFFVIVWQLYRTQTLHFSLHILLNVNYLRGMKPEIAYFNYVKTYDIINNMIFVSSLTKYSLFFLLYGRLTAFISAFKKKVTL